MGRVLGVCVLLSPQGLAQCHCPHHVLGWDNTYFTRVLRRLNNSITVCAVLCAMSWKFSFYPYPSSSSLSIGSPSQDTIHPRTPNAPQGPQPCLLAPTLSPTSLPVLSCH